MTLMQDGDTHRSYGCEFGCGNPYDFVIVSVADGSTNFVCTPCYLKLAQEILNAVLNPDDPKVQRAMAEYEAGEQAPMARKPKTGRRGHAPVGTDDEIGLEAFNSVITADDLPPEFRT